MDRFLVKHFDPRSRYTYVEAATPLAAAERFTGRKLKDQPPGDVVALVQITVGNVVTTSPFYADAETDRAGAAAPKRKARSTREVVVAWCHGERDRLLREIAEIEDGGMRVQRIARGGPTDITAAFLKERRASIARLDAAMASFGPE